MLLFARLQGPGKVLKHQEPQAHDALTTEVAGAHRSHTLPATGGPEMLLYCSIPVVPAGAGVPSLLRTYAFLRRCPRQLRPPHEEGEHQPVKRWARLLHCRHQRHSTRNINIGSGEWPEMGRKTWCTIEEHWRPAINKNLSSSNVLAPSQAMCKPVFTCSLA